MVKSDRERHRAESFYRMLSFKFKSVFIIASFFIPSPSLVPNYPCFQTALPICKPPVSQTLWVAFQSGSSVCLKRFAWKAIMTITALVPNWTCILQKTFIYVKIWWITALRKHCLKLYSIHLQSLLESWQVFARQFAVFQDTFDCSEGAKFCESSGAVNSEDIDAPILFYFIYLFISCLKLPWSQGKSFKEAV